MLVFFLLVWVGVYVLMSHFIYQSALFFFLFPRPPVAPSSTIILYLYRIVFESLLAVSTHILCIASRDPVDGQDRV